MVFYLRLTTMVCCSYNHHQCTSSSTPSMFCCCSVFTSGFIPSLNSWCRAWLICPWTFILCTVHLLRRRRAFLTCVCSMLCCRNLPHNLHCQPEKQQVYFGGLEHNNSVWVPVFVLFVVSDCRPSQGSSWGFQKAAIRWMLSVILNCLQLQFL